MIRALATIDRQLAAAMRLQNAGCDNAQALIDTLFAKRDAIRRAAQ